MLIEAQSQEVQATGTITTAASTVALETSQATVVTAYISGTYAGVNITFETSADGTTWFPINAMRQDTGATTTAGATGVLTSNLSVAYVVSCQGAFWTRVRSTAWTCGTATVVLRSSGVGSPSLVAAVTSGTTTVDSELPAAAALADAAANPTAPQVGADNLMYNGATWDRVRNNAVVTVETSAARTATANGTSQVNYNSAGAVLFVNVTAASGTTPTLVVKVQHSFDGTTYTDIPGAATATINSTGVTVLTVYPGATPAANVAVSLPLPRFWRLAWTIGGTTPSFTFAAYAAYVAA